MAPWMITLVGIASALAGGILGAILTRIMWPRQGRSIERTAVEQLEYMRNLLAFMLVLAFISVLPVFTFKTIPEANEQIITYMVGQLSGMALTALGFYFVNKAGQDVADAKRSENTKTLGDAINKALDQNAPSDGKGGTIRSGDTIVIDKVERDAGGLPWDERIHVTDKTKDEAGKWVKRTDVDFDVIKQVEDELRARGDA